MGKVFTSYIGQLKNIHKEHKDAEVVVVMRHFPGYLNGYGYKYAPFLAPSAELLSKYKSGSISPEVLKRKYLEEMTTSKEHVRTIKDLANKTKDVFLVCVEKNHEECHRSALASLINDLHGETIVTEWRKEG